MEALETLAVALGFASLAGVNLYLTVLIAGLAVNQQWIDVSEKFPELMVLGEPAVLIAAGVLTAIEFFSDKIPWVDSAWDSVHTLIRPIGGGLLALTALGPTDPAFGVIIALLAGGTSLMTHGLKAGTRLAINQSPEPVSNMAASLTEDMAVMGGLAMMSLNPMVFAAICILFIGVSAFMAPKLFRRSKAFTWLVWATIGSFFWKRRSVEELQQPISPENEIALNHFVKGKPTVSWSTPVILGTKRKFPGITANTFGHIFSLESDPGAIHFVGKKSWKRYHSRINLDHFRFLHDSRFASEDIILENSIDGRRLVIRLTGGSFPIARKIVDELAANQITPPVASPTPQPEPPLAGLPAT